jgi:hypothetical protein
VSTVHQLKSQVGGYVRRGNLEAAEQARRALRLAVTEQRIAEAIEAAPELDADTIAKLHSLIPAAPSGDAPEAA